MDMLSLISFAAFVGLVVGTPLWGVGLLGGYSLAVRGAHRSSSARTKVFRGLAEPWGSRIAKLKPFPLWCGSVVLTAMIFAVVAVTPRPALLGLPALLGVVLAGNVLAGLQKGIAPAERTFFHLQAVLRDLQPVAPPDVVASTRVTIVVKENELTNGAEQEAK